MAKPKPPKHWRRRERTCLRSGCDVRFYPALFDEWYCSPTHRTQSRAGVVDDMWTITVDEKASIALNLGKMEKFKGRRGIRFGRGLKAGVYKKKPKKGSDGSS